MVASKTAFRRGFEGPRATVCTGCSQRDEINWGCDSGCDLDHFRYRGRARPRRPPAVILHQPICVR